MTWRKISCILIAATVLGVIFEWRDIQDYKEIARSVSETICDVVELRAQGGSTRDVYDQVFSFVRKHAPDKSASVLIRHGGKELGSVPAAGTNEYFQAKCSVENTPDYEIISSFQSRGILSTGFVEKSSLSFLVLFAVVGFVSFLGRKMRNLWSEQILFQIRHELGLEVGAKQKSILAQWLSQRLLSPLATLKQSISSLQHDLNKKQEELLGSNLEIERREQEKLRAEAFEEKVRMVRHDLRGPLSAMKLIGLSDRNDTEVVPQIIQAVEKILSDLDQRDDSLFLDGVNAVSTEIAEVAIQEAIEEKRIALDPDSQVTISYSFDSNSLSPVKANPKYLRRIIGNLIQNSLQGIDSRKGIIEVRCYRDHEFVHIDIADNGIGVEERLIPLLFKKGATFGKHQGTGLGLFFVKTCIWPISPNGASQFHQSIPPDFMNRSHPISSNGTTCS